MITSHYDLKEKIEVMVRFKDASPEVREWWYSLSFEDKIEEIVESKKFLPDDFPEEERRKIEFDLIRCRLGHKLTISEGMKLYEKFNSFCSRAYILIFLGGILFFLYKIFEYFFMEGQFEYGIPILLIVGSVVAFFLHAIILGLVVGFCLNMATYCVAWIVWKIN